MNQHPTFLGSDRSSSSSNSPSGQYPDHYTTRGISTTSSSLEVSSISSGELLYIEGGNGEG
jgi:hypothetical protein